MSMILNEREQVSEGILKEIAKNLDITKTQYEKAVESYQAVGSWLAEEGSPLALYKPEVLPQGSFLLGTMIKPIVESDELDVDIVCRLEDKEALWTQADLKQKIGDRLKEHGTYKRILDKEGRRCWTLNYAESSKYHMDILPALVSDGYGVVLEKAFSARFEGDFDKTAIRITDRFEFNYRSEINPDEWPKSNPFGYAVWFQDCCRVDEIRKGIILNEAVNPFPEYQPEKLPLQRAIQILKRHRDINFEGDEHKPISIIITTLASKAYKKETNVLTALRNIVNTMESFIEEKFSHEFGKNIKWIQNPVNDEENFADKWPEEPKKQENFYRWLQMVKEDFNEIFEGRNLNLMAESLYNPLGQDLIKSSLANYAEGERLRREQGNMFMAAGSGMVGSKRNEGTKVTNHNFHGKTEG